jgi:L-lactate dehydrogenase
VKQQPRKIVIIGVGSVGVTCYTIGLSLVRISEAVLRNEHSVLTSSTLLTGEYGLMDACLSVPCIIAKTGLVKIIQAELLPAEREALHTSAQTLQQILLKLIVQ